jgi:predicted nucleic acid-binding protein
MYLIDTNIITEVGKGRRWDRHVAAWYRSTRDDELFLSVLVIGEIRQGIERLRPRNRQRAAALEDWLGEVTESYGERLLPIDERVAQIWGRMNANEPLAAIDSLLAATAEAHGLTLVTRNLEDIERSGVRCLNPFEPAGSVE